MAKKTNPVLIVGAGPTGLSLAIECARHGVPFRLIDQNQEPSPYSKALGIWQGTMLMLQTQGILDPFLKEAVTVEQVCFADRGHILGAIHPQEHEFSSLKGPIVVPQSVTERLLEKKLKTLKGKIERGVQLIAYTQTEDCVEAKLQHANGKEEIISVPYLAGCDGARSITRKTLESDKTLEFSGMTEPQTFLLADVEFEGAYQNNKIMVSWSQSGTIALFPVTPNILRVIAVRQNNSEALPTLEEVQTLMDQHGPQGIMLKNPNWLSLFRINERLSSRFVRKRVFLLGDAAHIHSPAGGQGMNTGMQDAFNLGWKLALILRSKNAKAIAKSYGMERRPVAQQVVKEASQKLRFGMRQSRIMLILKDILLPVITRAKPVREHFLKQLSELFIEYHRSPLIIPNRLLPRKVQPGRRWLPNPALPLILGPSHTLIKFTRSDAEYRSFETLAKAMLKDLPVSFAHIAAANSNETWIRDSLDNASWYLVRPDGFIAAGGMSAILDNLKKYVKVLDL